MKYLAIDGDDIGRRLEQLLLSDRIEEARAFSEEVENRLANFRSHLEKENAQIIFCSGDSLLAEVEDDFKLTFELSQTDNTTWSAGIGSSPSEATLALKKAKGLGRNRIQEF